MAGASMNDIKARMKSVKSTMQITKAMELVATSKLRKAKENAEKSRPFYDVIKKAMDDIDSCGDVRNSEWCKEREVKKTLYIVMAGDRGLAGGYNSNIFKLIEQLSAGKDSVFLPIGKKALDYCRSRNKELYLAEYEYIADTDIGDALDIGETVASSYVSGEIDKVVLVYTRFVSMLTQAPVYEELLPFVNDDGEHSENRELLYDGDAEELLDKLVPIYVGGIVYSALCESLASESGARRSAMSAANKNASEMIDTLMLKFNRARQAVITQEITEIVSGAAAQ
jgi:F-type H+-transporting ATPase subunit gamma